MQSAEVLALYTRSTRDSRPLLATWLDWDMLEAVISAGRILAGAGRASYRKTCLVLLSEGPPFGAASPVEFEVRSDGLRELNLVADGLHL